MEKEKKNRIIKEYDNSTVQERLVFLAELDRRHRTQKKFIGEGLLRILMALRKEMHNKEKEVK